RFTRVLWRGLGRNLCYFVGRHWSPQAVGAKYQRVPTLKWHCLLREVRLNLIGDADSCGEHMFLWMRFRIFRSDRATLDKPGHQRMISGELSRDASTDEQYAAVANMRKVHTLPYNGAGGQRCSHPVKQRLGARFLLHPEVCIVKRVN